LWEHQVDPVDLFGWVVELAEVSPTSTVLDVGCGNGNYLTRMASNNIPAVGCDLSLGMLAAARPNPMLINGDCANLPFPDGCFDTVLAAHMLYHVDDRLAAISELRRVLRAGGRLVAVTNGAVHMGSLRDLVEVAAHQATPGWVMRVPADTAFSLENGAGQLAAVFESVELVRPSRTATVELRDPRIAADYVASTEDHYQSEVDRPWWEIVAEVQADVEAIISRDGYFVVEGDTGAFICR
jgi:SAM-dependent methyltransferase